MCRLFLRSALVVLLVYTPSAHCGVSYYQNQTAFTFTPANAQAGGAGSQNFLSGSYSSNNLTPVSSAFSIKQAFDTDNLKTWVDQLTFNLDFGSKTLTSQLSDINGNLKSVTTTINFDPLNFTYSENSAANFRKLSQGTGGAYGLVNTMLSGFANAAKITGRYTVQGPTQSRSGNFSLDLNGIWLNLPDFINLSNPGQEVVFSAGLSPNRLNLGFFSNSNLPAIYSVVDDVNLAVGMNLSGFQLDSSQFKLQAIPEPSALLLLVVGLGGLAIIRRRRR